MWWWRWWQSKEWTWCWWCRRLRIPWYESHTSSTYKPDKLVAPPPGIPRAWERSKVGRVGPLSLPLGGAPKSDHDDLIDNPMMMIKSRVKSLEIGNLLSSAAYFSVHLGAEKGWLALCDPMIQKSAGDTFGPKQARKPRSYASPKLCPATDWLTYLA